MQRFRLGILTFLMQPNGGFKGGVIVHRSGSRYFIFGAIAPWSNRIFSGGATHVALLSLADGT